MPSGPISDRQLIEATYEASVKTLALARTILGVASELLHHVNPEQAAHILKVHARDAALVQAEMEAKAGLSLD